MLNATAGHGQQTNQDFELGMQKYHQSDWDGAITNFSKTIESSFDLYNSYSYRAYARAMKRDSNGAIADCNQVIRLNPTCSCGYYWRSRVQMQLTNFEGALADFEIGLRLNPKDRPTDLAEDLLQIIKRGARGKFIAGDTGAAITNLNLAIHVCPTNWSSYLERSYWKLLQGNYGGAIADSYVSIKHYPEQAFPFEIRAWARYELNDVSGATEDCKQALKIYDEKRSKEGDAKKLAELDLESALDAGLQDYINGDFADAAKKWESWLNGVESFLPLGQKIAPATRSYFQKWLNKAQAQLKEKKA